jgi:hypothetical protein
VRASTVLQFPPERAHEVIACATPLDDAYDGATNRKQLSREHRPQPHDLHSHAAGSTPPTPLLRDRRPDDDHPNQRVCLRNFCALRLTRFLLPLYFRS